MSSRKLVLRNSNRKQDELVKYIINEDEKVVTCIITCYIDSRSIGSKDKSNYILDSIIEKLDMKDKTVVRQASVKCCESDDFNIEFGKTLAYSKAKMKCIMSIIDFIRKTKKDLLKTLDDLTEESYRYLQASKVQFKDIMKLVR